MTTTELEKKFKTAARELCQQIRKSWPETITVPKKAFPRARKIRRCFGVAVHTLAWQQKQVPGGY